MNSAANEDVLRRILAVMPKATMPAELRSAIEDRTIFYIAWYRTDAFRLRWIPALIGLVTVLAALGLSRIQHRRTGALVLPVAARRVPVATLHAALPFENMSNAEKGDRRDHQKSSPTGDCPNL